MAVLDTDFLVGMIRGDPDALRKLALLAGRPEPVSTTAINLAELFRGAFGSRDSPRGLARVRAVVRPLALLSMEERAAEEYGKLTSDLERRGLPVGHMDSLIAAVARVHGEAVITRNTRHYSRVSGLRVETW